MGMGNNVSAKECSSLRSVPGAVRSFFRSGENGSSCFSPLFSVVNLYGKYEGGLPTMHSNFTYGSSCCQRARRESQRRLSRPATLTYPLPLMLPIQHLPYGQHLLAHLVVGLYQALYLLVGVHGGGMVTFAEVGGDLYER